MTKQTLAVLTEAEITELERLMSAADVAAVRHNPTDPDAVQRWDLAEEDVRTFLHARAKRIISAARELEAHRRNARVMQTVATLVRGIPSVVALLEHLEKDGGWIQHADFGPACDTVEKRAESLLKTFDGTYATRELTKEEL